MQNVLYYFIAVSVIGAVVCIYDKLAAARGWKRVPERTLHRIFMLGIPAVMVLQAAILLGIHHILLARGFL